MQSCMNDKLSMDTNLKNSCRLEQGSRATFLVRMCHVNLSPALCPAPFGIVTPISCPPLQLHVTSSTTPSPPPPSSAPLPGAPGPVSAHPALQFTLQPGFTRLPHTTLRPQPLTQLTDLKVLGRGGEGGGMDEKRGMGQETTGV